MIRSTPSDNDNQDSPQPDQPAADETSAMPPWSAQLELLRGLAQIVEDEGLSELELEGDGVRLVLRGPVEAAPGPYLQYMPPVAGAPLPVEAAGIAGQPASRAGAKSAAKPDESLVPIVTPMVGVFYRANAPDSPPLVEVGDYIEVGQEVGLVEAMKSFNEITSEVEGTVVEILAQNTQLVETGNVLMMIKLP